MSTLKRRVRLPRHWESHNQSTGTLIVVDEKNQPVFQSVCIERGDRNNAKGVSNVIPGIYPLVLEYSPKFNRMLWEIKNVPNRDECKIHSANFWKQLNGCIAPGLKLKDMDNDGFYDVTNSADTLTEFHKALEGLTETTIEIIDPC